MLKRVLVFVLILSAAGLFGCSSSDTGSTPGPASVNIVREAEISTGWEVKQMEIGLEKQTPVVLILKTGDKVDGYFYITSGDNVTFSIAGNSQIYQSANGEATGSDRFTFTASQTQGIAYILTFNPVPGNDTEKAKSTVFLELEYPVTGEILMPVGTK